MSNESIIEKRAADRRAANAESVSASIWHVGREVPLALLAGLIIQTAGVVWWLASLNATVAATVQETTKMHQELSSVKSQLTAFTGAVVVPAAVLTERVTVLERQERETRLRVDGIREEQMRRFQQRP